MLNALIQYTLFLLGRLVRGFEMGQRLGPQAATVTVMRLADHMREQRFPVNY